MSIVVDAIWALLAAGALGLWVAARRLPDRVARPGDLLGAVMANRAGRVVVLVVWMFAGWHFFAR